MDTLARATHLPRLLCLGTSDQFTSAAAMQQRVVQEAGGVLLEDDDSFAPLAQGGGGAATVAATQQQQEQLQQQDEDSLVLRLWLGADHFWLSDVHRMVEYCVGWIEKTVGGSSGSSSS